MLYQRTIGKKITITGIGIHLGKKVTLTLHPARADFGIQFKRVDVANSPVLKAEVATVGATENNTAIGEGKNSIHTVEHLLSVFNGLGINNVYCELDGPEVPIMDGSGASFVFILKEAGIVNLSSPKKIMVILEPIAVVKDDRWAKIEPSSSLIIDSTIIFSHPFIKKQNKIFKFSCENYVNEISKARTFGLLKNVDELRRKGLIKGGSLENAIVLDDFKVINKEGLRYEDEFIRHKILDIIGDISLLGYEIAGKVTTYKSGHELHNLLCKKLLSTPSAYQIVNSSLLEKETIKSLMLPKSIFSSLD